MNYSWRVEIKTCVYEGPKYYGVPKFKLRRRNKYTEKQ